MTTSQTDTTLYEPTEGGAPIDPATKMYFAGLARHLAHEFLLEVFERSNLSRSDLASRLSYDPSRVSRLLNTPSNITIETFGEMLFAIDGSSPRFEQEWLLREPVRNYDGPEWLTAGQVPTVMYTLNDFVQDRPITKGSSSTHLKLHAEPA